MFSLIKKKREVTALGIRKIIGNSPIKSVWFIGNGFDRACGLNTGYSDFFDKYVSIESQDDDIIKFKERIKNERELWVDLEIRLAKITKDYGKDVDTFLKCFEDLHTHLDEYLKDVEKKAKHEDYAKVHEEYEKLYNNYFENIDIETTVFVVMNYTDNFENFIKTKFSGHTEYFYRARIIYVHGNLSKGKNILGEGGTVLGIGDPTQIGNLYFIRQSEFRQKFIKSQITDTYSQIENYFLYQGRDKIGELDVNIFGCSMGVSDNAFWNMIFGRNIIKIILYQFVWGYKAYCKKLPKITLYNYTSDKAIKEFDNFSDTDKKIFGNYKTCRKATLMTACLNMTNFIPTYLYFLGPILRLFPPTSNWLLKTVVHKINNVVEFVETNDNQRP